MKAEFNWQWIVVFLLLAGAIYYLIRTIRKSSQGDSCGSSCDCEPGEMKKKT